MRTERYTVLPSVLRELTREYPPAAREIDISPSHVRDLAATLSGQNPQLEVHAYRRPRDLTWLSGIALLGLALAFGFSGYLLPWNKVSYFATKVGTDMAAAVPVVGEHMARFLRGGNDVGGGTLTRFFGFHVAVLPGITTLLLFVHLVLQGKNS